MNHIFIQARMNSKRFPNKILKKIFNKTILQLIVERAKKINFIDDIILVTGNEEKNKSLINESEKLGIKIYSGSDENLLDRFYNAGLKYNSKNIIRLTGDSPLIDYTIINSAMSIFQNNNYDILSVDRIPTLPIGMNFEIFTHNSIKTAWNELSKTFNTNDEFLNNFISPVQYLLSNSKFNNFDFILKQNFSHYRVTIDYKEDFDLVKKIFQNFTNKEDIFLSDITSLLDQNIDLQKINQKYSNQ